MLCPNYANFLILLPQSLPPISSYSLLCPIKLNNNKVNTSITYKPSKGKKKCLSTRSCHQVRKKSYRFHCDDKASVCEEDNEDRDDEMADKHVDDVGLIVELRVEGVIIRATGALHSLREVSVLGI